MVVQLLRHEVVVKQLPPEAPQSGAQEGSREAVDRRSFFGCGVLRASCFANRQVVFIRQIRSQKEEGSRPSEAETEAARN
jgi:hypothetical protein